MQIVQCLDNTMLVLLIPSYRVSKLTCPGGTGGDSQRQYDPADMLDFAWDSGFENESPETLYMLFVEHQQREGLRQEEQEQQEMLMMRRARMSESGVMKLRHPHIAAADGEGGVGLSRSRLPTDPIWVAGATVGLPGKIRE